MINAVAVTFILLFVEVFNVLIIIRVLMSWIYPHPEANRFSRLVFDLTEPVLGPVRKLLPRTQFLDLSPIVTFFLLQAVAYFAPRLLLGAG